MTAEEHHRAQRARNAPLVPPRDWQDESGDPLECDCGRPMFYDYETERYHHATDPERECFLIPAEPDRVKRRTLRGGPFEVDVDVDEFLEPGWRHHRDPAEVLAALEDLDDVRSALEPYSYLTVVNARRQVFP